MRSYELTERAIEDLHAARDWYDRASITLGDRFIDAVLAAIRTARERPMSCPVVRDGVRATRCRRFPYRVYFETEENRIVILAVYHTARDPRHWDDPSRG